MNKSKPQREICQDIYTTIFESVITDIRLNDGTFDTLLYLSSHSKDFNINQTEAANHCGVSTRTMARRFKTLIEAGYITAIKIPVSNGRYKKYKYLINSKPQVNDPDDHFCNMNINGLARDASFPSTYKRIICIVLTYPGSFNITPEYIANKYGYHIQTVEKAFKLAIEKGYMHRTRLSRNNGEYAGFAYAWNNQPVFVGIPEGREILPDNVELIGSHRKRKAAQKAEAAGNKSDTMACHTSQKAESGESANTTGNKSDTLECPHKNIAYINIKNYRNTRANKGDRPPMETLTPEERQREEQIKIAFDYLLEICGKHQADNFRAINKAYDAIESMIDACPDISNAAEMVKAAIDRVKTESGSKPAAFIRYNFLNWINDGLNTPEKIKRGSKAYNPALDYMQHEYSEGELEMLFDNLDELGDEIKPPNTSTAKNSNPALNYAQREYTDEFFESLIDEL